MIAIIPARGGSKGLPGKNTRLLQGKPLIAHTIEAAIKAKNISEVIVTTDSSEIAKISENYGANVPFLRPDYLSGDDASAIDVYLHAVNFLSKKNGLSIDKFVVLLPTVPLRNEVHIDKAIEKFTEKKADTLVSVCEAETPPSWYFKINEEKLYNAELEQSDALSNRQDYQKYYIPNGAIYILDYNLLKQNRTYYSDNTIPFLMERRSSVDIDNLIDFEFAEFIMSKLYE